MLQEARAVSLNDYFKPICRNYRYWTPTEKTVREFLTEKKAIRVSCTIPVNNNCCPLLRVVRCTQPNFTKGGGGGGLRPGVPSLFFYASSLAEKVPALEHMLLTNGTLFTYPV